MVGGRIMGSEDICILRWLDWLKGQWKNQITLKIDFTFIMIVEFTKLLNLLQASLWSKGFEFSVCPRSS